MEYTPGSRRLPFAKDEITMLHESCKSLSLNPIEPGQSKKDVMDHLRDCEIFHFAGHGHTDFDNPSNSHLRLQDWKNEPLTVQDLLETSLHNNPPFLAYLSACGTGRVDEGRFIDESLNLISAFQLASGTSLVHSGKSTIASALTWLVLRMKG
jgi:CHAT domain-containing protein